jgi:cysteine desulfurase
MSMTYFDYAATTPMTAIALKTYIEVATHFSANPNSPHPAGQKAQALLQHCRDQLAQALCVPSANLIFTSGGSESNQLALALSVQQLPPDKKEVLVSPLEHASIWHELARFPELTIKTLPLYKGQITPKSLAAACTAKTGLVIVGHVHSITGITQNIDSLAAVAADHGCLFHCDCVQSFGKLPLSNAVTSWSGAAHKLGGPKSCGVLYLNPNAGFTPLVPGISQEFGFRAGTVDLAGIASFTEVAISALQQQNAFAKQCKTFGDILRTALKTWGNFATYPTQPQILGLLSPHLLGTTLVEKLAERGYYLSTTAACNTFGVIDPTLASLGLSQSQAEHFIRVSFGEATTQAEVAGLVAVLKELT